MELAAAPVLDDEGVVMATISASDLRGLRCESFNTLLLPVLDFLRIQHAARGTELLPPVTCTIHHTLGQLIAQLLDNRVHRSWVVQSDRASPHPIGVVTMTDLISCFSMYH